MRFVVLALLLMARAGAALTCPEFLYELSFTREESERFYRTTRLLLKDYKNEDEFYFWFRRFGVNFRTLEETQEAWLAARRSYPSPDRYEPKEIDLSEEYVLEAKSLGYCALCPWLAPGHLLPSVYGVRLIEARRRDRVHFADRNFTLGEFLGRGNAGHIFALSATEVLKLPFAAGTIEQPDKPRPGWIYGPTAPRVYLRNAVETMKALPEDLPHVRVVDHAKQYEWAVFERIDGEDGRTFLRGLPPEPSPIQILRRHRLRRHTRYYLELALKRYPRLALHPDNEVDLHNTARQFLARGDDWVLVDSD